MALPKILKNMNLYLNGAGYRGECPEVAIPKLARKMDGYRGAGMDGEIQIDMGQENIEFEWKMGGHSSAPFSGFGAATHDAELLRWVGAYQDDGTGKYTAVEITVRGRHQEIDPGTGKPGDKGEQTIKTVASYYKLTVDGSDLIEIDIANLVFIVNGVDRHAELRAIMGI